jgi:L-rhamnose isomerase/sugar isomerase
LNEHRLQNDPVGAQEVLQAAFQTDVRPLLREARMRQQSAANPLQLYRELNVRQQLIKERGVSSVATGL